MKNIGFTLIELLISLLIISILLTAASSTLFNEMNAAKANFAAVSVRQIITEARSLAKTRSESITVSFSEYSIAIVDSAGNQLNKIDLDDKVKYNAAGSSISSNSITFNFNGFPVGADGTISTFTNSNNRVAICYYDGESEACTHSKTMNVMPITGIVETN